MKVKGGLHVLGIRKAAEENVRACVVSTKVSIIAELLQENYLGV